MTLVIPCMWAFPDHIALKILLTELGEVNTCLYACGGSLFEDWRLIEFHCDENGTSKGTLPHVLWFVFTMGINENRPLVSRDLHFTTPQCCFGSKNMVIYGWDNITSQLTKKTVTQDQSSPTQQDREENRYIRDWICGQSWHSVQWEG